MEELSDTVLQLGNHVDDAPVPWKHFLTAIREKHYSHWYKVATAADLFNLFSLELEPYHCKLVVNPDDTFRIEFESSSNKTMFLMKWG